MSDFRQQSESIVMQVNKLDHVNLKTSNLDTMVAWYRDVLGMKNGERPPFQFPGAWMYAEDMAVVHLVGIENDLDTGEPQIEHFALTATGLDGFLKRLDMANVEYRTVRVPGLGILQVNVFDPDDNHIHIDFSPQEADELGL